MSQYYKLIWCGAISCFEISAGSHWQEFALLKLEKGSNVLMEKNPVVSESFKEVAAQSLLCEFFSSSYPSRALLFFYGEKYIGYDVTKSVLHGRYLRMELLEGVAAYHSGQLQKSKDALTSAQAKYLQVSLSLLLNDGLFARGNSGRKSIISTTILH